MLSRDDHVVYYVDAYLHEALGAADAQYVEQHCSECRICRVALEEAQVRFEVLGAVPAVEASEDLIQSTQRKIDEHGRHTQKVIRRSWITAAAAILLVGITNLYYYNLSPSPYDLKILGQSDLLAGSEGKQKKRLAAARHNFEQAIDKSKKENRRGLQTICRMQGSIT